VVLSGKTPSKAKHRGRFCIYAEPVAAGKIAKAYVDDVVQVRLLVPEEAEDCRFAEIDDVRDLCTNELLAQGADPVSDPHKWQRPSVGWMIEATFGIARFDDQGDLVLTWINEMVEQEKCEDDEGSGGTPTG
jgi:hypothetical protein